MIGLFRVEADVAELLARMPNTQERRYPDAGHLIPVEKPKEFADDLIVFAERC